MPILIRCLQVCILFFAVQSSCLSHEGRPVYIEVVQGSLQQFEVRWKIPPVMPSGSEPLIELQGTNCTLLEGKIRPSLNGRGHYQCAAEEHNVSASSNLKIKIHYPDNNPVLSSLILYKKLNGESISLFNGPDTSTINLPKKLTFTQVAIQYVQGGFSHILSGFDHLLFVLCLMQIAIGGRRIILTISGFTLGHSMTLIMASLGWVSVRINVIEVLIALSIVMLILELTKKRMGKNHLINNSPSLVWRYPVLVAILFGLLHGFGFASALGELGLPSEMKISALAFFNVGVELGQLAFVAFVWALLTVLKRVSGNLIYTSTNRQAEFPLLMLYGIGALSSYWMLERSIALFI